MRCLIIWSYGLKIQSVFYICPGTILTHLQATENCYKIQTTRPFCLIPLDPVTFTTSDPVLPLPSPQLLAVHAACAQVAHLSGARKYIDKHSKEMKEMKELAEDGTSSEVLHNALTGMTLSF